LRVSRQCRRRYKYFGVSLVGDGAAKNNGIFGATFNGSRATRRSQTKENGLDYLTTPADPRVPWTASPGRVDSTSLNLPVEQGGYTALNSPIAVADMASGGAQLIEAGGARTGV
jgi:hypothetical protein